MGLPMWLPGLLDPNQKLHPLLLPEKKHLLTFRELHIKVPTAKYLHKIIISLLRNYDAVSTLIWLEQK